MVLFQAVISLGLRYVGRSLTVMFSWATIMLFGRIPQERRIFLTVISFGSVIWLVALPGVASPGFSRFLLSFVTLPGWVDRNWVRTGTLAGVVLPPRGRLCVHVPASKELSPRRPSG